MTLKNSLDKEILEIDKLYDKVNNEIIKSFEIKHQKLINQENILKEKLKNEVIKTKENLKNYLFETIRIIKINEKIYKGIKSLEKEELNIFRKFAYITKINKSKKEIKYLLQELVSNLNISFNEEESELKFDKYYFSGMQKPKDIEIKGITSDGFYLIWKIDNLNTKHFDKNNIKFKVELRKDNNNDIFSQVYEGNNMNCLIENLAKNTHYEIRICTFYDNLNGPWSELQKIKTNDFDSIILKETQREKEFVNKILEWCGYKKMELLYRGTRDGTTSLKFHEKCDHKGPTICLYKNIKGYIFGGYSSISWTSDGKTHEAKDSFIFTLTNIYSIEPTKFLNKDNNNVNHHKDRGPCFGNYNDIDIRLDFKNSDSYSSFPCNYKDSLGKGKSIFTGDFDNNTNSYRLSEIEVFKLLNF